MIAIIPSYYNFTKEENNKLRKNKHGFRLEKMKKDYKLEDFGLLGGSWENVQIFATKTFAQLGKIFYTAQK